MVRVDADHLVLASVGWSFGDGWLAWCVSDAPPGVTQAAAFRPKGLLGLGYWWALWPVHQVVFRVMLRGRVRRARLRAHPAVVTASDDNPLETTMAT